MLWWVYGYTNKDLISSTCMSSALCTAMDLFTGSSGDSSEAVGQMWYKGFHIVITSIGFVTIECFITEECFQGWDSSKMSFHLILRFQTFPMWFMCLSKICWGLPLVTSPWKLILLRELEWKVNILVPIFFRDFLQTAMMIPKSCSDFFFFLDQYTRPVVPLHWYIKVMLWLHRHCLNVECLWSGWTWDR